MKIVLKSLLYIKKRELFSSFYDDQVFYDGLNMNDSFGKKVDGILNTSFDSIISKLYAILEAINDSTDKDIEI